MGPGFHLTMDAPTIKVIFGALGAMGNALLWLVYRAAINARKASEKQTALLEEMKETAHQQQLAAAVAKTENDSDHKLFHSYFETGTKQFKAIDERFDGIDEDIAAIKGVLFDAAGRHMATITLNQQPKENQ